MKVMPSGRQTVRQLNYFSALLGCTPGILFWTPGQLILGVLAKFSGV